jgi:hypothetical protein
MTKAELQKSHDSMAKFLAELCRFSDEMYGGYRTGDCDRHYRKAVRLLKRAGHEYHGVEK